MAVTLTGRVRTSNDEDAAGTVTIASTGSSVRNGVLIVADSSGPVTLETDGSFDVPWVPGRSSNGQPATVTVTFSLTNGDNPDPLTVAVPDTDGATINVFENIVSAEVPSETLSYLTTAAAQHLFVEEARIGGPATSIPSVDGRAIIEYGVAPLDFNGHLPGQYLLDPDSFGSGYALGYVNGQFVPVRVDDRFRGYVTSPPNEAGQAGDFFRNAVVSSDGAFVREWVCSGGSNWLAIVVNQAAATTTPTTPTAPAAGTLVEAFGTDGSGWGPDLPWTFLTGSGSRTGGYGYMAGGFTTATIARMDTALASPNHSAKMTWVAAPDTANRSVGVCTRVSSSATDLYVFEVNKSQQRFTFQKIVGGQSAWTSGFQALPSAITVPLTMELRSKAGGVHECLINDVLVATYNIADPALDSNVRIGAWQYNGGSVVPVDNITAHVLT
jgi:hypothetical protein